MPRRPRLEFAGALYHISNRGNYSSDLFFSAAAARTFVDGLFSACGRMQWRLHAFALLPNQYHLAVETPRGNLVTGVHWLQSVFGNRFNRFRGEPGRAFHSRYRADLVEPGVTWAQLVDFIHLSPVRAQVVTLEQLRQFRWSSYRLFLRPAAERSAALTCAGWLRDGKGLDDTSEGWRQYGRHLEWLMADASRQRTWFARVGSGWAQGSSEFRRALREDLGRGSAGRVSGDFGMAEINRAEWQARLEAGLKLLRRQLAEAPAAPKSASWKIALAADLKSRTSVPNRWLGERLHMGPPDAVSRYVGELHLGKRAAAAEVLTELQTGLNGAKGQRAAGAASRRPPADSISPLPPS
jgi:putative transposase